MCRVFTVRRRRTGVPHVTQATRDSGPPRLYGPATKNRIIACNPGDPGFGSAAFLRSGGDESACRTQPGRPGFQTCWAFTIRPQRIGAPHGTQSGRPRLTRSRIRRPGALGPAFWGTRPPRRRENIILPERACEGLVFLPPCRGRGAGPAMSSPVRPGRGPKEQRRYHSQRRN